MGSATWATFDLFQIVKCCFGQQDLGLDITKIRQFVGGWFQASIKLMISKTFSYGPSCVRCSCVRNMPTAWVSCVWPGFPSVQTSCRIFYMQTASRIALIGYVTMSYPKGWLVRSTQWVISPCVLVIHVHMSTMIPDHDLDVCNHQRALEYILKYPEIDQSRYKILSKCAIVWQACVELDKLQVWLLSRTRTTPWTVCHLDIFS